MSPLFRAGSLIEKCLQVGVLEGVELSTPESGTAQGSVLSPLLGNVYLHYALDRWIERRVKPRLRGQATLIRYADDFVIGFEYKDDAKRVMDALGERLGHFGLTLHPDKTRLLPFRRPPKWQEGGKGRATFDFLGFTLYWARTRTGRWAMFCKTRSASLRRIVQSVYDWCRVLHFASFPIASVDTLGDVVRSPVRSRMNPNTEAFVMNGSLDRFSSSIGVMIGLVILTASIAAAGSASAEENGGAPVYVGIGVDFGFEDFDNVPGGIDIDEAYGFNAWAGYRMSDLFSAELSVEYLDGFDFSILGFDVSGQALASTVNAKIFPLARVLPERFEPFLYTGIGVAWAEYDTGFGDADETSFVARFGGGIDLYVTENVALQASSSYVLPTGDLDDISYVSLVIGLQYRFGRPSGS